MDKKSKIYIAGHTGVIGNALFQRLKAMGYENLIVKSHKDLDLLDEKAVKAFFEAVHPDYVFYCAAVIGDSYFWEKNAYITLSLNLTMQMNVLRTADEVGTSHFLYIGSGSAYGDGLQSPFTEEHATESIQQGRMESYALVKITGLELCKLLSQLSSGNFVSLMPTHIYGSWSRPRLVENLMKKIITAKQQALPQVTLDIWGTGKLNPRQFLYVEDLVDAMLYFVDCKEASIINIASEEVVTLDMLAHTIAEVVGYQGQLLYEIDKPEKASNRLMSVDLSKSLGFTPKYTLKAGLEAFYRTYDS